MNACGQATAETGHVSISMTGMENTPVINYTVPDVQGYTTEQTHEGWMVTFSTSLFSASTYTFTFEIFSRTGGANLTITNPWYSPVQYSGSISQLY